MTSRAADPVKENLPEVRLSRSSALSGLQPVSGETLGTRVYGQLRDFLMVGGLQPGGKITLRELTTACGTSLMPVREAVQRLAAEGALEILPNRAIRVPLMTKHRVEEILRVRLTLEGMAVEEAASRIDEAHVAELETLNDAFTQEMQRRDDSARLFRANKEFHFLIYRVAEMPVLLGIIENLWLQFGPFLHFSLGVRGRDATRKFAPDSHSRLLRAMRLRDGALARTALAEDLCGAANLVLRHGNLPE